MYVKCKSCGQSALKFWELKLTEFSPVAYNGGGDLSAVKELTLDAGVFCSPKCLSDYVSKSKEAKEQAAADKQIQDLYDKAVKEGKIKKE